MLAKVLSLSELPRPITLAEMRSDYGMKGAPQGLRYLSECVAQSINWKKQKRLLLMAGWR